MSLFLSVFYTLFPVASASAQTLTFESCLAEVLRGNPRVQAGRYAAQAARQDFFSSLTLHLPTVGGVYERDRSEILFPNRALNTGPSTIHRYGLRASMNVFSGLGLYGTNRAAADIHSRAGEEYRQTSVDARFELAQAFGRLLQVQDEIRLQESIAQSLTADAELVDARYQAGVAPHWSLLSATAQAAEARWRAAETGLALESARRRLLNVLGREGPGSVAAEGTLSVPAPPPGGVRADLETLPSVAGQRESLELARHRVTVAQSGFWPRLDLTGQYLHQDTKWPPKIKSWAFGIAAGIPIFSAPKSAFDVAAARDRVRQNLAGLEDARHAASDAHDDALSRYRSAFDRLAVMEGLVGAEAEREETLRAAFKSSRASYFEWNSAVTRHNQVRLSQLEARLNAYLARAAWLRSLGRTLEDKP